MRGGHTPGNPRILLPVQNRITQTNHGLIFVDSIARRVYNCIVALLVIWWNVSMTTKWRGAACVRKIYFAVGKGDDTWFSETVLH